MAQQRREAGQVSFSRTTRDVIKSQASMFGANKILGDYANPVIQNLGEDIIKDRINQIGDYLRNLGPIY